MLHIYSHDLLKIRTELLNFTTPMSVEYLIALLIFQCFQIPLTHKIISVLTFLHGYLLEKLFLIKARYYKLSVGSIYVRNTIK